MDLRFEKINGTNCDLNYTILQDSISRDLSAYCSKVEVLLLNKFPVSVSAQTSLDMVIFLKVKPNGEKRPRIFTSEDFVYITNLIFAVSIVTDYQDSQVKIVGKDLSIDNCYIDFSDDAVKLKWGLTNYLGEVCEMEREKITVHPVIWIKNITSQLVSNSVIVGSDLTFSLLKECIAHNSYLRYPGYLDWNNDLYYDFFIRNIFNKASKDSELGYYTKQKIERFHKSFDSSLQKAYDQVGERLVKVNGKAGTGKSSDLLKMMLKKSLTGTGGTFLTYNHLLVFDIARQLISFKNSLQLEQQKGTTTAYTIHQFMYKIAKKLGVLLLLSEPRVQHLIDILEVRSIRIEEYLKGVINDEPGMNLYKLKGLIQNDSTLDEGFKREATGFIKLHEVGRKLPEAMEIASWMKKYKDIKISKLRESMSQQLFLEDYHNVLHRTYQAIRHTDQFFTDFDIESKFELLEIPLGLKDGILLREDGTKTINRAKMKDRYINSIKGFRAGRILYIDEAQDCHSLEKDILYALFKPKNIVIASGGKEQLIRYSQLCDWDASRGERTTSYSYDKTRKSFRMKPAIVALANYIADRFGIALAVEPEDTEDHGKILLHRNYVNDQSTALLLVDRILQSSVHQGCTTYESLLLLKNAKQKNSQVQKLSPDQVTVSVKIDQFDVVRLEKLNLKSEWEFLEDLDKQLGEARIWNATGNIDKKTQSVPGSLSMRALYYESSRGLEAWAVMCFNIDGFFCAKREDDAADLYMLNDMFLHLDPEKRKDMYSATWVLMAITRAIDTCYLEINNPVSYMSAILEEFALAHPSYVEII